MSNFKITRIVLGAMDPEMEAIKTVASWAGIQTVQACADGKPVHPGNAYKSDTIPQYGDLWVECGYAYPTVLMDYYSGVFVPVADYSTLEIPWKNVVMAIADHHKPGDPGFGLGAEDYFCASSIGQVLMLITGEETPQHAIRHFVPQDSIDPDRDYMCMVNWAAHIAASDHCPGDAYQDKCVEQFKYASSHIVHPDSLMKHRMVIKGAFQKRSVEDILADVENAISTLEIKGEVRPPYMTDTEEVEERWYPTVPTVNMANDIVRDLRDVEVPELPEAALRMGVAYIASVTDRDGRKKVTIGGNACNQTVLVQVFMNSWAPAHGLVDIYGVPARGFAGGYIA